MEKMNQAFEKVKMLVGMEVDEEDQASAALQQDSNFMDEFHRNCTLSTKQVINSTNQTLNLHLRQTANFISNLSDSIRFGSILQRLYGFSICLAAGITCTLLVSSNYSKHTLFPFPCCPSTLSSMFYQIRPLNASSVITCKDSQTGLAMFQVHMFDHN